jgi:hypothetical protein
VAMNEMRPLKVGEVLDLAVSICRRRYRTLVQLVAVVVIPVQVFSAVVQIATLNSASGSASAVGTSRTGTVVATVLSAIAGQLATAACLRAVASAYLGIDSTWQDSLEFAWARFRSVLWIVVLVYVIATVTFVVFLLGVYLWFCWVVALPVLLIEGERGFAALRRSRELVRGRWWATAAAYVVAAILVGVLSAVVSGVLVGVTGASHLPVAGRLVVTAIAGSLGAILTTPFIASVTTVIYFDLRHRREGFALSGLAEGLGESWQPEAEPPWPGLGGDGDAD